MILADTQVQLTPSLVAPGLVIALCAIAGLGTFVLMPHPKKTTFVRNIGAVFATLAFAGLILAIFRSLGSWSTTAYFWIFSFITIGGALKVITHPLPVYSAMYFVLTVFSTAGLFVLLWAEFIAAALVLIYAGAVLVTYTFVIMLASEASGQGLISKLVGGTAEAKEYDSKARSPLLACLAGFITMGVMLFVLFDKAASVVKNAGAVQTTVVQGQTQKLGVYLFTNQIISVQVAGLILTLAMVGAIMIARKKVLLDDDDKAADQYVQQGPNTPADDNPHSISVEGKPGPRAGAREREMMEL
jgi:NADH-quinone oxidoreductase subunit J